MRHYIAIVHKDSDSDFGVSFPDFPGCVTAGSTLAEATSMAIEALAGHIDLMADTGEPIPEPSDISVVMSDPDFRDGFPMLIPAPNPKARAVRLSITLPEDVLQEIDRYAEAQGYTRSGFLAHAAKKVIREKAA
jgi:predicted RNase H-like HicB family nuclease